MNRTLRWVERVLALSTDEINWIVLSVVDEHGRETGFSRRELAAEIVEHVRNAPLEEGPDTLYEAENLLHHKHLPHLDEFGLLTYDRDSEMVSPGPDFDRGLRTLGHTMEMVVELSGDFGD